LVGHGMVPAMIEVEGARYVEQEEEPAGGPGEAGPRQPRAPFASADTQGQAEDVQRQGPTDSPAGEKLSRVHHSGRCGSARLSSARAASSALIIPSPSASSRRKSSGGPRNSWGERYPSPLRSMARNQRGPRATASGAGAGRFAGPASGTGPKEVAPT